MKNNISIFEKYLTVWVLLCMLIGVVIGKLFPNFSLFFSNLEIANVNIVISILIWLMIYPMMLKIDFASIKNVSKSPKGLFLTWIVNWLVKPFTMFAIAYLFFRVIYYNSMPELGKDYLAGAVLLGAAPCTAMVFVWSSLTKGDSAYTLVQVATNDLIILLFFVPIVGILLGIGGFSIPWATLFVSIILFVVIPLILGIVTRLLVIRKKGMNYLNDKVITRFSKVTPIGLLLTLVIIFTMQANIIYQNPIHIILISLPLVIQTFLIFFISYGFAYILKMPYNVAAPAGMIGASNFFELAVAVAIALFPNNPGVILATTVGVLVEVPVMLMLVKIANKTQSKFVNFK